MTKKKMPVPREQKNIDADVLIIGGGFAGMTLALALDQAGVSCVVVDRETPKTTLAPEFDGRTCALSHGSVKIFKALDVWSHMQGDAGVINDIRVTDGDSLFFLHYDHLDVGEDPFGYIVENRVIRHALMKGFEGTSNTILLAPAQIEQLALPSRKDDAPGAKVLARLDDGREIRAPLVVAADGRNSNTRKAAGIGIMEWGYGQSAIVCTVVHEKPHNGVAQERFLAAGPFAILPMSPGEDGSHRSSIVWTEKTGQVPALLALDEPEFNQALARRFGSYLGDTRVVGPRWSYPLSLVHADRYIGPRLALIGDAAHAIHPISGQGLNLGLRDVASLAEVIVDALRLGRDVGETHVLEGYERWRRFDVLTLVAVTDGLNRLFSNDHGPLRLARDVGLALVNRLPPLKKVFMRHAMGSLGDSPRLMRGEKL